jgi:hypothetical protein
MTDFEELLATVRDASTIVIAAIAVYYTAAGAFATKQAVFVGSTVASLLDVVTRARSVRAAYRGMFFKFPTVAEKTAARGRWLQQREEVGTILRDLAELLPEVAPAVDFWKVIEKEEDTFATADSLKLPNSSAINAAHERYDAEHAKFIKSVGEILRKLR